MKMTTREPTRQKRKSRKEIYQELYEASKKGGSPFFPDVVALDAVVVLVVIGVIYILAIVFPAGTTGPANPTGTAYNPRPEWYFIFFQEFLRLFPGNIEPVGATIVPVIAFIVLFLLPFIDRGLNRTWSRRKVQVGVGVAVLLAIAGLEVGGILFPPSSAVSLAPLPPPNATFAQLAGPGKTIYATDCASCHGERGEGVLGPALFGPKASLGKYGTAKGLLDYTSSRMPPGGPGSLSHQDYVDILAYLLIQNNNVSPDTRFDESQLSNVPLK